MAETIDEAALCAQVPTPSGETLPDTLALPLPCGHRMLFRKVRVPADFLLDQRVAAFGSSGGGTVNAAFAHGPWDAPISGVFSEDEDARPINGDLDAVSARSFYVGKYELTELQFALFPRRTVRFGQGSVGRRTGVHDRKAAGGFRLAGQHPAHDRAELVRCHRLLPRLQHVAVLLDRPRVKVGLPPILPWSRAPAATCAWPRRQNGSTLPRGGATGVRPEDRSRQLPRVRDPDSGDVRDARLNEGGGGAARGARRSLADPGSGNAACRTFWACTMSSGMSRSSFWSCFVRPGPTRCTGMPAGC